MNNDELVLERLKEALSSKGITMRTDYNSVSLEFPNGDLFEFEADGCEGCRLVMHANIKLEVRDLRFG